MIRVVIYINKLAIVDTHAVRIAGKPGERCVYKTATGKVLTHDYDEGAVALAKRLLDLAEEKP